MDARRIEVEGRVYELRAWTPQDGEPMAFRLLRLAATGAEGDGISAVLAQVSDKDFADLRDLALKYTDAVSRDPSTGEDLIVPLLRSREALRGRYQDLIAIIVGHLEHEFGPFFSSLPTLFGSAIRRMKQASS